MHQTSPSREPFSKTECLVLHSKEKQSDPGTGVGSWHAKEGMTFPSFQCAGPEGQGPALRQHTSSLHRATVGRFITETTGQLSSAPCLNSFKRYVEKRGIFRERFENMWGGSFLKFSLACTQDLPGPEVVCHMLPPYLLMCSLFLFPLTRLEKG